jgi:hypothetical protein
VALDLRRYVNLTGHRWTVSGVGHRLQSNPFPAGLLA